MRPSNADVYGWAMPEGEPRNVFRWTRIATSTAVDHVVPLLFVMLVFATYLRPSLAGDDVNAALLEPDAWWLAAGLVGANALVFRKRYPLSAALVVIVAVTFVAVAPYDMAPIAWMVYVSAFSLGRYAKPLRGGAALAGFVVSLVIVFMSDQGLTGAGVVFALAFVGLAWFAGRELRAWRARADDERRSADRRVELERQRVELSVAHERLHIARELHDVIAHSMGGIAVQAAMADAAFERQPEEARRAITNILDTSRSSLDEIRRILVTLRTPGGENPEALISPRSTLQTVLRSAEEAGLTVDAHVELDDRVAPEILRAATRIVQEALTNVIRHAHASRAIVSISDSDGLVSVRVVDDGVGAASSNGETPAGFGLTGMRERAEALGGTFRAGSGTPQGFEVEARIPHGRVRPAIRLEPEGSHS